MPDIRDVLEHAAPSRTVGPDLEVIARRARRRAAARRSAAVLAALVVLAGSFTMVQRLRPDAGVVLEQPAPATTETGPEAPAEPAAPPVDASVIEPAPLSGRAGAEAFWSGGDLLVWGGMDPAVGQAEGGALWNREDGWREIPAPPSAPGAGAGVAWTGRELYLAGGSADLESGGAMPLASYDAVAGEWRDLPAAPLEARLGVEAHWTGSELLVFGGGSELSSSAPFRDGALYDPETGQWRAMTPAPLRQGMRDVVAAWTGRQLVIGATSENAEREYDVEEWLSYDVGSDVWTPLPAPPVRVLALASNEKSASEDHVHTDAVWTGEEVLLLHSQEREVKTSGVALRLDTQTWRVLPDAPVYLPWDYPPPYATVWAGDRLIVLSRPDPDRPDLPFAAAYAPATDSWAPLPDAPISPGQSAVWNGRAVLTWGGTDSEGTLRNDGEIYTPPPPG